MASIVVPADLTVTLTMTLTLDGENRDVEITHTISSIVEYRNVIVDVPFGSELEILARTAAGGLGELTGSVAMLIQNLDDTNFCRVRVNEAGGDTFDKKLLPNEWLMFFNQEMETNVAEAAFVAFVDFNEIKAQFDTADSQVKVIMYNI